MDEPIQWLLDSRSPPERLQDIRFLLRPLAPQDTELDYAAVMESQEQLRLRSQDLWPTPDFRLEENTMDLERHAREHEEGSAFTYTVMNPEENLCLGCVYIHPLQPALESGGVTPDRMPASAGHSAKVRFWVRTSYLERGYDRNLLDALRDWFRTDWPFSAVYFEAVEIDPDQTRLMDSAGLTVRYRLQYRPGGLWRLLYG